MIPQQTFESYPVFGDNATKIKPDDAKYAAGFQQSDVLPAEWMNWVWNKDSKGISDLNRGMTSVETEILNVLTAGGQTPAEATANQLLQSINYLIGQAETRAKLAAHPVGSLYWSGDPTDPGQLFGGTWAPVKDSFVWAKGDSDTANAIGQNAIAGGAKTHTITTNNLPNLTLTGSTTSQSTTTTGNQSANPTFSWTGSHTHGALSRNWSVEVANECRPLASSREAGFGTPAVQSISGQMTYLTTSKSGSSFIESKSLTVSGTTSGNHTHSYSHTHNVSVSASYNNAGINHMPPYIIKYCWERTA